MTDGDKRYVVLGGVLPHAGETEVLLAAVKSADPEDRVVIALSEGDARWLHREDRLDGWTPA